MCWVDREIDAPGDGESGNKNQQQHQTDSRQSQKSAFPPHLTGMSLKIPARPDGGLPGTSQPCDETADLPVLPPSPYLPLPPTELEQGPDQDG